MTASPTDGPTDTGIDTRLDALLADARGLEAAFAEGREPETTALEAGIQRICADIAALPRERGQSYLPRLQDLTDALDRIGGAMRGRLDGIGVELKQHGARQSAVRAYGKAGTPGGASDGHR
ncbi:hypothetical protein CKO28_11040 [Rhodovibrio sodomensis]|uniref:Flagellar protein FliT n=1 Tax=Rhodovibrio sodomensis TaxID=1088 RepID=A0ABS1DGB2_9PROT|nr:hypothetical protein [Rhodovibrio sodomensis]MBK1668568.1 hypothetical protein [Rhodovibrio sodomensis]